MTWSLRSRLISAWLTPAVSVWTFDVEVLVEVLAGADRGRAVLLGDDVEVVEPGGVADLRHDPRPAAAGELGRRGGELGELERREVRGRAVEEDARQDLVLRQRRLGREDDVGRRRPAGDGDDRGDVLRTGCGRRSGAAGRGCRRAGASPRRTRCAGRGRRAGRGGGRTGRPAGCRSCVPWMRTEPPTSTSRPRPRTKIWFGRVDDDVEPHPRLVPAGGGRGLRLADPRAVEGDLHRPRGVDVVGPASSAPAPPPPRPSAIEISVRPRSIRPESRPSPPISGPRTASSPESWVLTKAPSV